MRPSFWPNTPDILDDVACATRPRPPSPLRFVLAATLVPLYGIYSGYELAENEPASDTNTEYLPLGEVRAQGARLRPTRARSRRSSAR